MNPKKGLSLLLWGTFLALIIATLTLGATPWTVVWQGFKERLLGQSKAWNPLLDERIPRLIVTLSSGAALAVSGLVTQALFCNPLASPSVLGITAGGSLLAVLVLIVGWHVTFPFSLAVAAIAGSLVTLVIVYSIAKRHGGAQLHTLILTGIALSTVLMAIQDALVYAMRDRWPLIQTITEWMAGSTYDRTWDHVNVQLPLTIVGLAGCWRYGREINILALGEEEALSLGVDVSTVRWRLFLCVALLAGGALASLGAVAFFGFILPHILRRCVGPDHTRLIPLGIAVGGASLLALDLLLRTFSIHAFSIGNVSSILGGIFFVVLLFSQLHRSAYVNS